MEYSAVCFLFLLSSCKIRCLLTFLQPLLDGKDLDIEVDSTADSDSEEYFDEDDEDDDPFANIPMKVHTSCSALFFPPSYFREIKETINNSIPLKLFFFS